MAMQFPVCVAHKENYSKEHTLNLFPQAMFILNRAAKLCVNQAYKALRPRVPTERLYWLSQGNNIAEIAS